MRHLLSLCPQTFAVCLDLFGNKPYLSGAPQSPRKPHHIGRDSNTGILSKASPKHHRYNSIVFGCRLPYTCSSSKDRHHRQLPRKLAASSADQKLLGPLTGKEADPSSPNQYSSCRETLPPGTSLLYFCPSRANSPNQRYRLIDHGRSLIR